jgi:type I restriction enzyme S subunit
VPILRIDDYQTDWLRSGNELRRVRATDDECATWGLREGDLLINRVNSLSHLGKSIVVPASLKGAVFESNMMRVRLRANVLPRYVELYLASRVGKRRLTQRAKWAVNQASINQKDVRATPIHLPEMDEQLRVVGEVDRRLSILCGVETEVDANLLRATALRQSALGRAFGTS